MNPDHGLSPTTSYSTRSVSGSAILPRAPDRAAHWRTPRRTLRAGRRASPRTARCACRRSASGPGAGQKGVQAPVRVAIVVLVAGRDSHVEVRLDFVDESDVFTCELARGTLHRAQVHVEKSRALAPATTADGSSLAQTHVPCGQGHADRASGRSRSRRRSAGSPVYASTNPSSRRSKRQPEQQVFA